jgi:hypothetical protein
MSTAGFEPTIQANERPQTNFLERAATGTGPFFTPFLSILGLYRSHSRLLDSKPGVSIEAIVDLSTPSLE